MNRLSVWGKNSKEREGKGPKACSQATVSREKVSTEFDCRRIHVIVHQSASDLAVVHPSSLFGAESYSGQRERKSVWQGFQYKSNICELLSGKLPSVYIYTVKSTL